MRAGAAAAAAAPGASVTKGPPAPHLAAAVATEAADVGGQLPLAGAEPEQAPAGGDGGGDGGGEPEEATDAGGTGGTPSSSRKKRRRLRRVGDATGGAGKGFEGGDKEVEAPVTPLQTAVRTRSRTRRAAAA